MGTKHWVNALALNIFAPAVLRCAFVIDVIVYAVIQTTITYCRIAGEPSIDLTKGGHMMALTICSEWALALDSLNT